MNDSFQAKSTLTVGGKVFSIARLGALAEAGFELTRLPYSLRVLLENLLRREDGVTVPKGDIQALARWKPVDAERPEIAFMPARVLLQDFTGVPAVVDLAAMRDAMVRLGGDPTKINPLQPVELVIDHSVQVDEFGRPDAARMNTEKEFERNHERYVFLRWGQTAFEGFRVVPPNTGIVHQVNLECLARGVMQADVDGETWAYPDTLVGTDSHTTMINGLGVLGWGVGGIEAEAAMLGQPVSMLIPDVVGVKLSGSMPEGTTATDLVLAITQRLRAFGVVGKFVEFFGPGMKHLPLADRATLANMAPEYGATCGIFPMDAETMRYLTLSGRSKETVALVEAYMREQGLFYEDGTPDAEYTAVVDFDLGNVVPSLAGPSRPQDRVALKDMKPAFEKAAAMFDERRNGSGGGGTAVAARRETKIDIDGQTATLHDGSVVIAAITSCTNTSNPSVMLAAGLVAKKAASLGLFTKPWVKTSLAPGSKVVTSYLAKAGLLSALEEQRFHLVGYGCTTCIGNSGPLPPAVSKGVTEADLTVASVLSGNRNFEGRVHAQVRASYLASPPLVVAYALAGRVDFDPLSEPLGEGTEGPVFLRDVWPTNAEVADVMRTVSSDLFTAEYDDVFAGDPEWQSLETPTGATYEWDARSTYVQEPPYFEGMTLDVHPVKPIAGARVLALFGDSITTDHISPAGGIKTDSPAGRFLQQHGIAPVDFNSYGSRRGNHNVMMRGTFANIRIRNRLVPGVEGGVTVHHPSGEQMSIYDAAMKYKAEGTPLCVLAGKEYGTGSSRDWAAKGPFLQGVRFVVAESYERIHRSNLVGMGILPLEFPKGANAESLGFDGTETIEVRGLKDLFAPGYKGGRTVRLVATKGARKIEVDAPVRIDTPQEVEYYKNGGILQYVLRRLARG
jgi:aconitate hydratase